MFPPDTKHTVRVPGAMSATSPSDAAANAPAGSAMMPSCWYSSSISTQTCPSATETSEADESRTSS